MTATASSRAGPAVVRASVRSRVAAIPTWLLVGGVFASSVVYRFVYAIRDPAPWIFHDEIVYSELAKAFAETGHFAMRGVPGTGGFGVLYPLLIAPAYVVFDRIPDAYDLLRGINCVLMSATVLPVYLIARRLAGRGLALLAAALSVGIPSLMYTGVVMTENAFYPLVALWVLVAIRAFERPTIARQLVVFAVLALAFLCRVQAIVLLPVLVTAAVLVVLLDALASSDGSLGRRLWIEARPYWPTAAALGVGAVAFLVRQAVRGVSFADSLGAYGGITQFQYNSADVAHWALYHLAELDILLGVFPFAAFTCIALIGLRPAAPRPVRIFAAVAVPLVVAFVGVAAAYAADPVAVRIVERNVFHVAPIAFVALAAWIAAGAPRPWWAVAPAALFAGTLTLALPLNSFFNGVAVHSTSGLVPLWRWRDRIFSVDSIDEVVFLAAALAALLFVLVPRRLAFVLPLLVLLFYAAGNRPVEGLTHGASLNSYVAGVGSPPRDWIDQAVGRDADVATLWWVGTTAVPFWESQFFNHSVDHAYTLTGPYDGLFHTFTHVDVKPSGALPDLAGRPIRERYVMTDLGTRLRGGVVARNDEAGLVVYALDGPLAITERLDGLFADRWFGPTFGYHRFGCGPGVVTIVVENNPLIHPRPFRVRVLVGERTVRRVPVVPSVRRYEITVPVRARDGVCSVDLRSPVGAGTRVTVGDVRELGMRFLSARYVPRR